MSSPEAPLANDNFLMFNDPILSPGSQKNDVDALLGALQQSSPMLPPARNVPVEDSQVGLDIQVTIASAPGQAW
jgi:hypothetical protein